jgi:hypothetical protein
MIDNVASKYGKNNLTVSGHSQGGHVSYEMAVRNDVEGFHYNPAINSTQVREVESCFYLVISVSFSTGG